MSNFTMSFNKSIYFIEPNTQWFCPHWIFVWNGGNSSSKLNLIFIYFIFQSSEFIVINLIKSLLLIHSYPYFFIFSLLWLVGTSVNYLFPLISSKYPFTLLKIRFTFYVVQIFYRHISIIVNKNIFAWLFIFFNIIGIKIFKSIILMISISLNLLLIFDLYFSFVICKVKCQ